LGKTSSVAQVDDARAPAVKQAGAANAPPPSASEKSPSNRRIIYTATLGLVVRSFESVERQIGAIAGKHKGYVADEYALRNQGHKQSGTWTLRIPVEAFLACKEELASLGSLENERITTQDVGEEYVDVESRIASKKQIENRLLEMLKDRTGALKDVLELEAKLGVVREEIDRAQGRLNYLSNQTALSTIHLTAREAQEYEPVQAPTFATNVSDTWNGSVRRVGGFLSAFALFFVAVTPWAPLLVVLALLMRLLVPPVLRGLTTLASTKPAAQATAP
jgi:hypothetical protein